MNTNRIENEDDELELEGLDDDLNFEGQLQDEQQQEEEDTRTPEQKAEDERLQREQDRMAAFGRELASSLGGTIADALKPPEKPATNPQPSYPLREQFRRMTEQQRTEFLTRLQTENGGAGYVDFIDQLQTEKLTGAVTALAPMLQGQASLMVDNFKADMRDKDKMYAKVLPYFENEMLDVDKLTLGAMDEKRRKRELDLRYRAARSQMIDDVRAKAGKSRAASVQNQGGGRSFGVRNQRDDNDAAAARGRAVRGNPFTEQLAAAMGWSKEEVDEFEKGT